MSDLEAIITLRAELVNDAAALVRVLERIRTAPEKLRTLSSPDSSVAAAAFEIHNYYSVSENLMRRVAVAFENALDPTTWHKHHVARMSLEIPGIRPALVDPGLRARLDELRKFRHFFRNIYDRQLIPGKVADILDLLLGAHGPWRKAIERFSGWLDDLANRMRNGPSS